MKIGLLHPGQMGAGIASVLLHEGHEVLVALDDRSAASKERAAQLQLQDCGSLAVLLQRCEIVLSVVAPEASQATAEAVLAAQYKGLYCDLNAIAPAAARELGSAMQRAGCRFVDGAIIGPPPVVRAKSSANAADGKEVGPAEAKSQPASGAAKSASAPIESSLPTTILLSGSTAAVQQIQRLFTSASSAMVKVDHVGEAVGRASAVKICHSAYHKGRQALLLNVAALAFAEGVDEALANEWRFRCQGLVPDVLDAAKQVPPKAWRFVKEMEYIADTFDSHRLNNDFHHGAAAVFADLAEFKGSAPGALSLPEVVRVLQRRKLAAKGHDAQADNSAGPESNGATSNGGPHAAPQRDSQPKLRVNLLHQPMRATGVKVLCFHGWRTSGAILRYQCRDLPAVADWTFIDGFLPASGPPLPDVEQAFEGPFFEWWDRTDDMQYRGLAKTLTRLQQVDAEHGPFVGVLGFSQGAALAVICCAIQYCLKMGRPLPAPLSDVVSKAGVLPALRFGILFGGFVPQDPRLHQLFDEPLDMPMFSCWGTADPLKDKCERLHHNLLPQGVAVEHSGGHVPPTRYNASEALGTLARFVEDAMKEK